MPSAIVDDSGSAVRADGSDESAKRIGTEATYSERQDAQEDTSKERDAADSRRFTTVTKQYRLCKIDVLLKVR